MDLMSVIDKAENFPQLLIYVVAILFIQLIVKLLDFYIKTYSKRQCKTRLDLRRAFMAIRLIAGKDWPKIREEMMKEERLD